MTKADEVTTRRREGSVRWESRLGSPTIKRDLTRSRAAGSRGICAGFCFSERALRGYDGNSAQITQGRLFPQGWKRDCPTGESLRRGPETKWRMRKEADLPRPDLRQLEPPLVLVRADRPFCELLPPTEAIRNAAEPTYEYPSQSSNDSPGTGHLSGMREWWELMRGSSRQSGCDQRL